MTDIKLICLDMVGPQKGAVHVQADELDVRHFFRFTAWRTFSAMPSGVRP